MIAKSQIMRYRMATILAVATVLVVIMPIVLVLNWFREPFGPAEIIESPGPMALAKARELSQLPFPDSAGNIRYAHFRQWIAYETFARFEAPVPDCLMFAEQVIASSRGRLVKLDKRVARSVVTSSLLKTDWFDVDSIQQGMEGGIGPSHSPKVWIDMERGVCYYRMHD